MSLNAAAEQTGLDELLLTLSQLPPIGAWVERAACASLGLAGADVFTTTAPDADDLAMAERVCRPCPVREQCLVVALASADSTFGVWGGLWFRGRGAAPQPAAA